MKLTERRRRTPSPLLRQLGLTVVAGLTLLVFLWAGQKLTTPVLPQAGQGVSLYSNQTRHDLRQTYLAAFGKAKDSIVMIIYGLKDPQVIGALRRKAEQGVDVEVICDRKASRSVARKLGPQVKTHYRQGTGLMHQKIAVIDGSMVWIGSANMTTESLRHHGNLVAGFHHRSLAKMLASHAKHLANSEGAPPASTPYTVDVAGQQLEMWILPKAPGALARITEVIGSARQSVKVAMFTWTHPELTEAVIAAHRRGITVEAILDRNSSSGASAKTLRRLQDAGVDVAVSHNHALLHYKLLIVDDDTLVTGSANWTKAAFNNNDDCFFVLTPLTAGQKAMTGDLWHAITTESHKVPRRSQRVSMNRPAAGF